MNELSVGFKWKDAFDKGSLFGGKISLTLTSLAYERVCVLFNVGAFNTGYVYVMDVIQGLPDP